MSSLSGTRRYLVLVLTIALFAASALLAYSRIEEQKREFLIERNSVLWLATSLETRPRSIVRQRARSRSSTCS